MITILCAKVLIFQGAYPIFNMGSLSNSYMPILKNSFTPYLEKKHGNEIERSVDRFFEILISSNDIIGGGVWYIDNTPKVTNESAIDKFLTATSEFFKAVIFSKWQSGHSYTL